MTEHVESSVEDWDWPASSARAISPQSAEQPPAQGSPWAEAVQTLSGRFYFQRGEPETWLIHRGCPWMAEVDDLDDLAELVQRATEHTEVCR